MDLSYPIGKFDFQQSVAPGRYPALIEEVAVAPALFRLADVTVERLHGLGLEFGRAGGKRQQGRQRGPSHASILARRC